MSIDIPYTRYISFECLALNKPNFPFGSSSVEVLLDIFFGRGSMLICCYLGVLDVILARVIFSYSFSSEYHLLLLRGSLLLLIHSSDFQEWVYKRLPIVACCQEQRFSTMFVGHPVLQRYRQSHRVHSTGGWGLG